MAKTQKRVLIIRNAFQVDFGGAETYALNLAKALKNNGAFQPIIVTKVKRLLLKARAENIKAVKGVWSDRQWGWVQYIFYAPAAIVWYLFAILRWRIDIVHPQGRDDFIFATFAARLLGKPVIWTDHGDLKYIMQDSTHWFIRRLIEKSARYVRNIIVVSHAELRSIQQVSDKLGSMIVVHNGAFINEGTQAYVKPKNKLVIGATSRLVVAKGIVELIDAFLDLRAKHQMQLWLIGDGPDKKRFERQAKKSKYANDIIFLGYQEDIGPYLNALDIFIHPSYHEAFCLSIIEAAQAGKPIVATNTGGNPEIVTNDIGFLVPIKDSQALAQAIDRLVRSQSLRNKFGQAARIKGRKDFDFQKIIDTKIVKLYKDSL